MNTSAWPNDTVYKVYPVPQRPRFQQVPLLLQVVRCEKSGERGVLLFGRLFITDLLAWTPCGERSCALTDPQTRLLFAAKTFFFPTSS